MSENLLRRLQRRPRLLRRDPERGRPFEQEIGAAAASAARQIAIAPTTPTIVTISEIVPMSTIMPVRNSSVRVAAIGRKKAR